MVRVLIRLDLGGGPSSVVGGSALQHLLDHLDDPPFALVTGDVGGSGAPGTARCAAIGVSPLSGAVAETRAEGPFAAGLRAAGVTGIVVHGRASEPVCVIVSEGRAWTEPAGDLWGLETGNSTNRLVERYGSGAAVAVIGPAGERLTPYASIVTCRHHPLPRLGLGADLGARRVKAIVAVGSSPVPVADPSGLARIADFYARADNDLTRWQHDLPGFGVWDGEPGYAAVNGFRDTTRRGGVGIAPIPASGVAACPGCPTDCIKVYAGAGLHQEALAMLGPNAGAGLHQEALAMLGPNAGAGPHPEGLAMLGPNVGADPWQMLSRCEQLGLDPVEVGARLAGPPVTSKGVAVPPFDPRVQPNLGLAYAVSPIGPRYDMVEHDLDFDPVEGMPSSFPEMRLLGVSVPCARGELDVFRTAQLMRLWSGLDALGVCLFAATPTRPLTLAMVTDLVEAVTGSRPDVLALGAERLRLMFEVNRRLGIPAAADTLPDLFFDEPVRAGRYQGAVLERESFGAAVVALREALS
jgi:aldehyde:ferredoxin oxidoreductase